MSLFSRFARKVRRGPDCWQWTAKRNNQGYGMLRIGSAAEGWALAHRVSWEIHCGPIPDGVCVLHRCDNPECTNPEHLFLGSQCDNMRDKEAKGRGNHPRGIPGQRALTPEQGAEARKLHNAGIGLRTIARHFGHDRCAIKCWL